MSDLERLRQPAEVPPCPYVTGRTTRYCTLTPFTLTASEREAIEWLTHGESPFSEEASRMVTLRALLERTK